MGKRPVKIVRIAANSRRRHFEVKTRGEVLVFPYARLRLEPTPEDRVAEVFVDPELGREAFTYVLEGGREDSVHLDEVREYNRDPEVLRNHLLYRLTLKARKRVSSSGLAKRKIIRRLRTSASQLDRLLDPTTAASRSDSSPLSWTSSATMSSSWSERVPAGVRDAASDPQ